MADQAKDISKGRRGTAWKVGERGSTRLIKGRSHLIKGHGAHRLNGSLGWGKKKPTKVEGIFSRASVLKKGGIMGVIDVLNHPSGEEIKCEAPRKKMTAREASSRFLAGLP